MAYEYKTFYLSEAELDDLKSIDSWLNHFGEDGWELCQFIKSDFPRFVGYYIFRRINKQWISELEKRIIKNDEP